MAVVIEYVFDCPCGCGGTCRTRMMDCTADGKDGVLRIDLGMAVSQTSFECDTCGCEFSSGDWEDFVEADFECEYDPDDEDDEGERDDSGWRTDDTEWSLLTARVIGNEQTGFSTECYLGTGRATWRQANKDGFAGGSDDFLIIEIQDDIVHGITGADNQPLEWERGDFEEIVASINASNGLKLRYEPRSEEGAS